MVIDAALKIYVDGPSMKVPPKRKGNLALLIRNFENLPPQ